MHLLRRVIDQYIQLSKFLQVTLDELSAVRFVHKVTRDEVDTSSGLFNLLLRLLCVLMLLREMRNCNVGAAFSGKHDSCCAADATVTASDDGSLILKSSYWVSEMLIKPVVLLTFRSQCTLGDWACLHHPKSLTSCIRPRLTRKTVNVEFHLIVPSY